MNKDARPTATLGLRLRWLVSMDSPSEAAERESGKAIIALQKKDYAAALIHLQRAWWYIAKDHDTDAENEYRRMIGAVECLQADDAESAFYKFFDELMISPLAYALSESIGNRLAAQGARLLAIYALEHSDEPLPLLTELNQQLGLSEDEQERQLAERFVRWHEQQLLHDAHNANRLVLLADYQNTLERWDDALRSAQRAVKIDTELLDGYYAMAEAFSRKQEFAQALAALKQAEQVDPESSATYCQLAALYAEKLDDTALAIENYRKAIELEELYPDEEEDALRELLHKKQQWEALAQFLQERIQKLEAATRSDIELRDVFEKTHAVRLAELRTALAAVANADTKR